jgi:hypothetical protein
MLLPTTNAENTDVTTMNYEEILSGSALQCGRHASQGKGGAGGPWVASGTEAQLWNQQEAPVYQTVLIAMRALTE